MGQEQERCFAIKLHPTGDPAKKFENEFERTASCQDCGYPNAQGGDRCEKCDKIHWAGHQARVDAFDRFIYGGPTVHSSKFGTMTMDQARRRGMLDD